MNNLLASGIKYYAVAIFFLLISFPLSGEENKSIDKIFFLIYNQQFNEAEKELTQAKAGLSNLDFILLDIDLAWWEAIANNARYDFNEFEKKLSGYSLAKNHTAGSLEELVVLSYQFRLAAKRDQYFRMIHFFLAINRVLEQPEFSSLPPERKDMFNLYKAIFLYGKSKLSLLSSKLQKENLAILDNYASSENRINFTIANYFLARIFIETENSPKQARPYYEKLSKMYPGNKVFRMYLIKCGN
jgi:hypothetical protein